MMNEILSNLGNPAWWFTGIFFVAIFKLMPILLGFLKLKAKGFFRGRRLKTMRFIKANRHNLASVNFYAIKSQAFFVVFILVCALYIVWFAAGQLFQIQQQSYGLFLICMLPMAIAQLFWLIQEDKAKTLVFHYNKVRVPRPLNSFRP